MSAAKPTARHVCLVPVNLDRDVICLVSVHGSYQPMGPACET